MFRPSSPSARAGASRIGARERSRRTGPARKRHHRLKVDSRAGQRARPPAAKSQKKARPSPPAFRAAVADIDFAGGSYRVRGTDLSFRRRDLSVPRAGAHPLDTVPRSRSRGPSRPAPMSPRSSRPRDRRDFAGFLRGGGRHRQGDHPALAHGRSTAGSRRRRAGAGTLLYDENGHSCSSFMDYFMPRADSLPISAPG